MSRSDINREQDSRSLLSEISSSISEGSYHSISLDAPNGVIYNGPNVRDNKAQSQKKLHSEYPYFGSLEQIPVRMEYVVRYTEMAIMARDNLQVDKLLKPKPTRAELFHPTLPTYKDAFDGETEDEERQREQRNERRKVDWENECKQIEQRGPMIDRIPCDEADLKVKSLIYLSLGSEGSRTYHQRNPHTRIERFTTHEIGPRTCFNIHKATKYQV